MFVFLPAFSIIESSDPWAFEMPDFDMDIGI